MLTKRQEQVLGFIRSFKSESGYSPSVRDIGERFGLAPATVHDHLKALDRKGYIDKKPNRSRSLSLTKEDSAHETALQVPVVGRVAAGSPILAEENVESIVRFPAGWTTPGSFLLKVHGDSMEGAHILDGDYVLVRPQKTAANGEIVVVLIEDEATVKRFYNKTDRVELRAENPAYDAIEVKSSDAKSVELVGKVIGLLRM